MDANATAKIPEKYQTAKAYRTNSFFIEDETTEDILFKGNQIKLQNESNIGKGYILKPE